MNTRVFFATTVLTLGIIITTISPVFAATPTPTPTPKTTTTAVADAEIEREKQITKELSLNMPDQTEDPNYPVTFVDPSKQGVDITVDDKTTTKAPNPFLLPNLTIGEHKIIFKFKTKEGVVRVLTKKILVTPKAPQFDQTLKTEVVRPNSVTIKGTALPQATIMIIVNSDKTHKITSNTEGKWEFIIPDPQEGSNNIVAFTIKSGIVSTPSKTFTVIYKLHDSDTVVANNSDNKENPVISFAKTVISNIRANQQEHPTIFYGVIGAAVLGILVLVDMRLRKRAAKNRDEKTIATLFGNLQQDGGTIVEAIQSVTESVIKKKTQKGKKDAKMKEPKPKENTNPSVEVSSNATTAPSEAPILKQSIEETLEQAAAAVKSKKTGVAENVVPVEKNTKKPKKESIKSKPLVAESDSEDIVDETEEPEKKTLSKEEFLKQFQKAPEQGE